MLFKRREAREDPALGAVTPRGQRKANLHGECNLGLGHRFFLQHPVFMNVGLGFSKVPLHIAANSSLFLPSRDCSEVK